jgi:hypothetical protein
LSADSDSPVEADTGLNAGTAGDRGRGGSTGGSFCGSGARDRSFFLRRT